MINIREAVEEIIKADYEAWGGLKRGILNLSGYARTVQEKVGEYTKKEVGLQSIVVTLARLEKKFASKKRANDIEVRQLVVQSPIAQLVYPKNQETLRALTRTIESMGEIEDAFFSFSTSTKDIAIIISEKLEGTVTKNFNVNPTLQKKDLSAISIRFDEQLVREANVGLTLLQRIAVKNIVLDAALTTYNEFTLIFESKYLHDAIEALSVRG